jgi:hypothetical protein
LKTKPEKPKPKPTVFSNLEKTEDEQKNKRTEEEKKRRRGEEKKRRGGDFEVGDM